VKTRRPSRATCIFLLLIAVGLSQLQASEIQAPFPIQKLQADFTNDTAWKEVPIISVTSDRFEGETQMQYDDEALYLRVAVVNPEAVFAPAETITETDCRLYQFDSVEFWIGRRQVAVGVVDGRGEAYDYTAGTRLAKAVVEGKRTKEGYEILARLPWKSLEVQPEKRKLLLLSVWFNKMRRDGEKNPRTQAIVPATAEWGNTTTYGAAFLNDEVPVENCAPTLAPLAGVLVETAAFIPQDRLILKSTLAYGPLDFRCTVGDRFARTVRSGEPPALVDLPISEAPEIARLDLTAEFSGGNSFGPVSLEYFSHGPKPLTEYQSSHEPPKDFDAFWDARLAELASVPMEAVKRRVDRPCEVADLWEVTLQSWRGVTIVAYVSIPKAPGKYPLVLWLYPANATEAKDVRMSADEVVLEVHPRGFGASEKFSPKPDGLYVSNVRDPQDFYLLANILDVIRGIDFAVTLDQVDASRIFVAGGSRGGYLTLALAANDPRIDVASAVVPCYADVDLMGRLNYTSAASDAFLAWNGGTAARRNSMRQIWPYFDAVSFAHRIRCPIVVEAGMKDNVCAAPGIVDAFNRIASKKKYLILNPEHGHTGTAPGGAVGAFLRAEPAQ